MELSRRELLQMTAAATGVLAAAGTGAWWFRDDLHRRARRLYHRLADPPLPPSPPGGLDDETVHTLRAAAEALVGEAGRQDRYLSPFRWRAAHLPGHRELYRRFTRRVDRWARGDDVTVGVRTGSATGRTSPFASLPAAERRRLLHRRFPGGRLRHVLLGWRDADRMRMRRYVVQEILALYAATDAWTDLGYESWPGAVRGLDLYREPPPGAGSDP